MKKQFFLTLVFLLLTATMVHAVLQKGSMNIYAVTTSGEGLVANLTIEIEPGTGKIWSAVTPLVGTTTQNAERTAIFVAKKYSQNAMNYDYKFTISSPASVVEGPSAGAAMALLASAMLSDKKIPANVSLTGTVNEEGIIGPVGGVFEKIREASKTGVKLFMIPRGEALQTVKLDEGVRSINLIDYAPKTWGVKVIEVESIDQALKLAFQDIGEIDVNSEASNAVPEFLPKKILIQKGLSSFKVLTTNYINETRGVANEARNALSSTLLEDPEVTSFLLEVLNDAEGTLERAEILNEQNYLYSAANFAFLARVNAIMVKEVSNNPDLLKQDSTVLDLRVSELQQELNNFKNQLNANIPKNGSEWFASAQQRFTYAENTVKELRKGQTIVISEEGTEDKLLTAFSRLQDYAYAVAWLDVSKDFYYLSIETDGFADKNPEFGKNLPMLIESAEEKFNSMSNEVERSDILRRIDAAKTEQDLNWFEAGVFDAASAKALAESEIDSNAMGKEELKKMLEEKIGDVEKKFADKNPGLGWPLLYLDHAKYFLEAANYYEERGFDQSAETNLKSGLSLAYLADELYESTANIIEYYSNAEAVQKNETSPIQQEQNETPFEADTKLVFFGVIFFMMFLAFGSLILVASVVFPPKNSHLSLQKEIEKVKTLAKKADAQFLTGAITEEKHAELASKYSEELGFLEEERKQKAGHVMNIETYSAEINSCKEQLKQLKKHEKEEIVSKEEVDQSALVLEERLNGLKRSIQQEENALKAQGAYVKSIKLDDFGTEKDRLLPTKSAKQVNRARPTAATKQEAKPMKWASREQKNRSASPSSSVAKKLKKEPVPARKSKTGEKTAGTKNAKKK